MTEELSDVHVVLETEKGAIEVRIYRSRAPHSARAFLTFVDEGGFRRSGRFYRSVRKGDNDSGRPPINVIQGGLLDAPSTSRTIPHEPTASTGLRHNDGAISLARGVAGTATGAAFFICIGAQPALDSGGLRHPDGQGFAVFGQVVRGMDTVVSIHESPTTAYASEPALRGQLLNPPIRITLACRKVIA